MFDILDFIDSKDIREYNRGTHFYPIEQAVLIYLSRKTTVEAKLSAWQELLDTYGEDAFRMTSNGERQLGTVSNRSIVSATAEAYTGALQSRYNMEGAVFEAMFYEVGYDSRSIALFSDYDKAFEYLKAAKQLYLDDEDLRDILTAAEIKIKLIDKQAFWDTTFYFDTNLEMIDIMPYREGVTVGLDDFFVYLPLPFKKGDILRTTDRRHHGVLSVTPDREHFRHGSDVTNMCVTLDEFYKDGDRWIFGWDHYDYLKLEFCPDDELPREETIFFHLRSVYRGEMSAGELLYLYSHYGERAYTEFYGGEK